MASPYLIIAIKMRLGQHFMKDENILKRVADSAQLKPGERVLEIGPGEGALTKELVKICSVTGGKGGSVTAGKKCSVTAIEKDDELYDKVRERFPGMRILHADALKVKWPPFDKCVSNLPYSISKPFLLRLLQHDFKLAVLVLQEEFAQKMMAMPGDKGYGVVAACAQLCCEIELLDKVPRNAFSPQPKVGSRIVRLRSKKKLDPGFLAFATKLFQNRNKKMGEKRVRELTTEDIQRVYNG